jgi:hypothetical protein
MDDQTLEAWNELERCVSEVGVLAAEAECYRTFQEGDGPTLLKEMLSLTGEARDLGRQDDRDAAAVRRMTDQFATLAARHQSLLHAVRTGREYHDAVAAYRSEDAEALRRSIPAVFADVEPAPHVGTYYYYPVSVSGRRGRVADPAALASRLAALSSEGSPAAEPGEAPGTDAAFRAVVLQECWDDLDTPVALRISATRLTVPAFRFAPTEQILVYASHLTAPATVALARSADPTRWPDPRIDHARFLDALGRALDARGCAYRFVGA